MTRNSGFAPAKINLTLHVTGQRGDGYHLLDSLVVFADVGDDLTVAPSDALRLTIDGPLSEGVPTDARNLVLKAAALMGVDQAAFHLTKRLPAAAGIGGGSSDAAAALRLLAEMTGRQLPTAESVALGADVPVCLAPRPLRMRGVGEVLDTIPDWPALPCVLVNPRVSVPTPEVFRRLTSKTNPPLDDIPALRTPKDAAEWLRGQRNDLEPPARQAAPVIGDVLAAYPDALLVRMSGSGATCFGLYETENAAHKAARSISSKHPQWWVTPCVLGGSTS